MSSATSDNTAFFTCSCEEGLLRVDYFEEKYSCCGNENFDKEFCLNFAVPCFQRMKDRLKMIWNILHGKPSYYLTLNKDDAARFGQWLIEKTKE